MKLGFGGGFESQREEVENLELEVEGEIPEWLDGSLYRNGPAIFETNDSEAQHWFDGLAMLNRYRFRSGNIYYTNRALRSDKYREVTKNGFGPGGFATGGGILDSLKLVFGKPPDNASISVARLGGRHVALTESPGWVGFDPATLEATGRIEFEDDLGLHQVCAHLHRDEKRGETIGMGIRYGRTSEYVFYKISDKEVRREEIASIDTRRPSYVHSFGLTENYILFTEVPFDTSLSDMILSDGGFIQSFEWRPSEGTTLHIIDRETGETEQHDMESFFTFHHVNAYEDEDSIVMDLVEFEDSEVLQQLFLDTLESRSTITENGSLVRYRIKNSDISKSSMYRGIEMPQINRSRHTLKHRYVYGQATAREGCDGIVKVDTDTGESKEWWEEDTHIQEPVHVQEEGSEDSGVLLSTGLDKQANKSFILVLDSSDLEELGRAYLPFKMPFGFHGKFYSDL
ncbi:MAG: carotenoid oxygenase [Candidatus Nanosalina sp. J07AB43]|nr:MAG: carotenoid oxygenase [Candidatus Nanosalina sp. J07AB43]